MNALITKRLPILLLLAAAAMMHCSAPSTVEAATKAKSGKYKGKTGSTGRISFRVDRKGKKIKKLSVSIFALGQDDYGNFTQYSLLASNTDRRKFRIRRSGRFSAAGVDKNGIRYKVDGKLYGSRKKVGSNKVRKKFKGTAEMSHYRYSYWDYFNGWPVYELVSGSRRYKAKN
ncbi:MAG: hypothetical protein MI807_15775 [Verrucomicrobiales bacterium]|nr:hypothetical protein [Verrucomicrobiales bacterium]